jgi:hypothetical protein
MTLPDQFRLYLVGHIPIDVHVAKQFQPLPVLGEHSLKAVHALLHVQVVGGDLKRKVNILMPSTCELIDLN